MSILQEIADERGRQQLGEGWTPEHDDEHDRGEMAMAAACYAAPEAVYVYRAECGDGVTGSLRFDGAWPWNSGWWKPKSRRRDLIRAAALIVAEIERLDRAACQQKEG